MSAATCHVLIELLLFTYTQWSYAFYCSCSCRSSLVITSLSFFLNATYIVFIYLLGLLRMYSKFILCDDKRSNSSVFPSVQFDLSMMLLPQGGDHTYSTVGKCLKALPKIDRSLGVKLGRQIMLSPPEVVTNVRSV